MNFATRAIHVGQDPDPTTGSVQVPIYQTSTYQQEGIGKHKGYEYARTQNPTRSALETCLASLENGKHGACFGSGLAATGAVMNLLSSGDHVVCGDDLYGGTFRLFLQVWQRYGLEFTPVDMADANAVKAAIKPNTKLMWLETPTNPMLKLIDIAAMAKIAAESKLMLAVDNTFASPALQNPLDLGAHIVVHSTTKYIGGHSDVVGGAIIANDDAIFERIKFHQNAVGAVPGPFDCWLTMRGVKTLAIRMKAHCENAMRIASFLSEHKRVSRVIYPGLKNHPQHELAAKQMKGFGGMLSFELTGGFDAANAVLGKTKLFLLAESLGGVESLIGHPATMTHASIPKAVRESRGLTDGLIRISVGIEDVDDLCADLDQALR